jgi:hypothetical protein
MQPLSLTLGILAIVGMIVGFLPCLGALNWLNIPFAAAGLIISIIAFSTAGENQNKNSSITGIILCAVAIIFGVFRLFIGGGLV